MAVIRCPHCHTQLELDAAYLGQQVQCGQCGSMFTAQLDDTQSPLFQATEPSARPRDWGDDDGELEASDLPPRREITAHLRERDIDFEYAYQKVNGPAVGLLICGWLGVVFALINLGASILLPVLIMNAPVAGNANRPGQALNQQDEAIVNAVGSAVGGVIGMGTSILIILGANRLKVLENHSLAMTAAIVAMIPCFSPCCLIGLPFGIMALQALNDPEVRAAFQANQQQRVD